MNINEENPIKNALESLQNLTDKMCDDSFMQRDYIDVIADIDKLDDDLHTIIKNLRLYAATCAIVDEEITDVE